MRGQGTSSYARSSAGKRSLVLFVIVLSALLALPAIASAAYINRDRLYDFKTEIGNGEQPRDVAIEQSTGNAFVLEQRNHRVLVFTPSGLKGRLLTTRR